MGGAIRHALGKRRWVAFGCALAAAAMLTVLLLAFNTETDPASAASSGPEMGLNVISGGVCDAPQPTSCDVPLDGDFTLTIDLRVAPAAGYIQMQTYIDIGTDLDESTVSGKIVWPDAYGETTCVCLPLPVGHFFHFDWTGSIIDPPLPISNYTGPLVQLSMSCSSTLTQTEIHLLPYGDPIAGTAGTILATPTESLTPKLSPLTVNCVDPATITGDTDGDGCDDILEIGTDETLGGLRNPLNRWDFYDVLGSGGGPPDQIVDLPNDILGVIEHFSPAGAPPYDVQFDRGPSSGPQPWSMTAPDGVIDLPNDILGVITQFNHSCQ